MESCNALTGNEQAMEIFVLSPEILKKLGINFTPNVSTEGEPSIFTDPHKVSKIQETNHNTAQNVGQLLNEVFNSISNGMEDTVPVKDTSFVYHEVKTNAILDDSAQCDVPTNNKNTLIIKQKNINDAKHLPNREFTSIPNFQSDVQSQIAKCSPIKDYQILDQGSSIGDELNQQTPEAQTQSDKVYLDIVSCAKDNHENNSSEYFLNNSKSQSCSSHECNLSVNAVPKYIVNENLTTPINISLSQSFNEYNDQAQIAQGKDANPEQGLSFSHNNMHPMNAEIVVVHKDNESENGQRFNTNSINAELPYEKELGLNNTVAKQKLPNVFSVNSDKMSCNILDAIDTCDSNSQYIQHSDLCSVDSGDLNHESSEQLEKRLKAALAPQCTQLGILPNIDNQIKLPNIDILKQSIANKLSRLDKSFDDSLRNCYEKPKISNESALSTSALNAFAVDKIVNCKLILNTEETGMDITNYAEPFKPILKDLDDHIIGKDCTDQTLNVCSSLFQENVSELATFEKQVYVDKNNSLASTSSVKDSKTIKESNKHPNKGIDSNDTLQSNHREDQIFSNVSNELQFGDLVKKNDILPSTPNAISETTSNINELVHNSKFNKTVNIVQNRDIKPLIIEPISLDKISQNLKLRKIHKISWQKYKFLMPKINQHRFKNVDSDINYKVRKQHTENIRVYISPNKEKRRYSKGDGLNSWEKTFDTNAIPEQISLPTNLELQTLDVTFGHVCYNDTPFYDRYHKNYPITGNLMLVKKTYPSKKSVSPKRVHDSICISDTNLFHCSEDQPLMVYKSTKFKHICTFNICPLRSSYFEYQPKNKLASPLAKHYKSYSRRDKHFDGDNFNNHLVPTEPFACIKHEQNGHQRLTTKISFSNESETLKCGVCDKICYPREWLIHSANEHNYIAWIDGFRPIDLSNYEDILRHLSEILKFVDTLHCNICGAEFRQGDTFWNHIQNCRHKVLNRYNKLYLTKENNSRDKNANEKSACPDNKEKWKADIAVSKAYLLDNKLTHNAYKKNNTDDENNIKTTNKREAISGSKDKLIDESKCNSPQNATRKTKHEPFEPTDTGVAVKTYLTQQNHVKNIPVCNTKSNKTYCRKRFAQSPKTSDAPTKQILEEKVESGDIYECGACGENISVYDWIAHIGKEHKYLSWKKGLETLDVSDAAHVRCHLRSLLKDYQALRCYLCGSFFYHVLKFQTHSEKCDGSKPAVGRESGSESDSEAPSSCEESESRVTWNQKFNKVPAYSQLLEDNSYRQDNADDLSSELSIQSKILKKEKHRKYNHRLKGTNKKIMGNDTKPKKRGRKRKNSSTDTDDAPLSKVKRNRTLKEVECGVCHSDIRIKDWFKHIHQKHAYLAWPAKEPAIDFNDERQKLKHLESVIASTLVLKCNICSNESRTVEEYIKHVSECKTDMAVKPKSRRGRKKRNQEIVEVTLEPLSNVEMVKCAVCSRNTPSNLWTKHNMDEHFNLAWIDGTTPLDLTDMKLIEKRLKEYKGIKRHFVCDKCGLSRVSCMGFYAHFITCQKTDAEIEALKVPCDECNEGQLPIYMQQHKYYHKLKRQQAEHKESLKAEALEAPANDEPDECVENHGRRRAAVKAKAVLDKIKVEVEIEPTMIKMAHDDDYEEDNNEKERQSSEEEEEPELEDMVPEDSFSPPKRVRPSRAKEGPYIDNTPKCPVDTSNPARFILNCMKEFCDANFSEENLFPHLKCNMFTPLPAEEWPRYLPPVEESCSVAFGKGQKWTKVERFGSHRSQTDVWCVFAGAPIACVSWAPPSRRLSDAPDDSMLMVSTHPTSNATGLRASTTHAHPALLQLWNFGQFQSKPKFVLGIAHNWGTVWGMDWCPSGCRDGARLGLLAAACSNGAVYILPVCQPGRLPQSELPLFRTKPVLKLRLTSGLDREMPQATSVAWHKKKGHSLIVVGYSDGYVGMYNLNANSPLLVSIVKGSTVLYPFTDIQLLESPISGVSLSGEGGEGWAAWCGSVAGGAGWRGHSTPAPLYAARQPVAPPVPLPHHPLVLLPLDAPFLHGVMEMWWGGGTAVSGGSRWSGGGSRWAGGRLAAACWVRARLATLTRSALLLAHAHPALAGNTQIKCKFLMLPKSAKPKGNLVMAIEPNTYEEAIEKYGLCLVTNERKGSSEQTVPERYQLSEMTCVQFCPASKHCRRLAVAGTAGFIFLFNVS